MTLKNLIVSIGDFRTFCLMVLLFPIYLLIKIVRPLKLIRFGSLNDSAIGHFIGNTELYLCERDHGFHPKKSLDIFFYSKYCRNFHLLEMWKRILKVNYFVFYLDKINNLLPSRKTHKISTTCSDRDVYGLLEKSKIHLFFTKSEVSEANQEIQSIGLNKESSYICIAGRDDLYKNKVHSEIDWSYHNYRDSDINNYVLACEELSRKGYFIIRMGSEVKDVMETHEPKIIEYFHAGFRTELLDIYLSANCYFFINGESGLGGIPRVFRRPIVFVNQVPLEYIISWDSNMITIPKKYWLKKEHRFMTFREIFKSGAGRFLHTYKFEKIGIELIENSPEEIRDAAIEMDERLKGTWVSTEEDEELQKDFWSIHKSHSRGDLNKVYRSRIGMEFLRQNRELLD